jgi:predicted site-specific integrase-resolvase
MRLSQYAKRQEISCSTALRRFHKWVINGYQAPSGTIIVTEDEQSVPKRERVAIDARVSSAEHRENLERQPERFTQYCMKRCHQVVQMVKEIASGVNDSHPKLLSLLRELPLRCWWWSTKIG